jgi:hemerythrin-like domain-containing protein
MALTWIIGSGATPATTAATRPDEGAGALHRARVMQIKPTAGTGRTMRSSDSGNPGTHMADLLALWHAEHVKFGRLLNLLEQQVHAFHAGEQPDYDLMSDIVYYLRHYADAFHHPREDIGFERLVEKDPGARGTVSRLIQEHRVIGEAGRELQEKLNGLASDAVMPRGAVESAAATYLVYYRHHLMKEESEVLPRIARVFTPQDWAEVGAKLAAGDDPLFGENVDARFRALRRQIAREANPAA